MNEYPMWIAGESVRTSVAKQVRMPYDDSVVGTVFEAGPAEVDRAIEAARKAAPSMRSLPRHRRSAILYRAQSLLAERKDEIANILSSESGKPIREARVEVDRGIATLMFSAEEAHRLAGEEVPIDAHPAAPAGRMGMTIREPLGVIAAITPFNFPLNLSLHKIGPALAAGNTVVHKPATATPITALLLARVFHDAGLPAGALNVVTGPGGVIGDLLTTDPRIAMITFTGSPDVGEGIGKRAGMKRVTLELGSNSALILEADADLEKAIPRCVAGAFANSGQVCISIQRIYAHASIRNAVAQRIAEGAAKLKIGHPLDDATEVSSLISQNEADRVSAWLAEAVAAGGKLLTGGTRTRNTISPAVLTDVPANVSISCREAFGPLVAIYSYDTLDEAIGLVNASEFGLQAGIYTRDLENAFRAAREIQCGGVHINEVPAFRMDQMPYGGMKRSGTGREGPRYAIEEMSELKLITW